jgi:SAM-dependent methyltransferase
MTLREEPGGDTGLSSRRGLGAAAMAWVTSAPEFGGEHRVPAAEPERTPPRLMDCATPAKVYDALLGGSHTFGVDRRVADRLSAALPDAGYWAEANRAFLRRAVHCALAGGVRQFLDVGCGLPATVGSVHDLVAQTAADTRVVYVDIDPVVVTNAADVIGPDRCGVTAVWGDLRNPDAILSDPQIRAALDFSRPVAVLLVAVLHFVDDSHDPAGIVARLRDEVAPGSYLVISHATEPADLTPVQREALTQYSDQAASLTFRSVQLAERLFDGCDLVQPGVCQVPFWRPDEPDQFQDATMLRRAQRVPAWAVVAVKR